MIQEQTRLLIAVSVFLAFAGCVQTPWERASQADTIPAYKKFLAGHPGDPNAPRAQKRIEELHWMRARKEDKPGSYRGYLKKFPGGKHAGEARAALEEFAWESSRKRNDEKAYESYLAEHPEGRHAGEARRLLEVLYWKNATGTGTTAAYEKYLGSFPEGKHAAKARRELEALYRKKATKDLLDVLSSKKPGLAEVRRLVERGADLAAKRENLTPLMWAAMKCPGEIVGFLLDRGADKEARSRTGITALMFAADRGNKGALDVLLKAGADVNAVSKKGYTALMLGAAKGDLEMVKKLVAAGADLYARMGRGEKGMNALDYARKRKNSTVVGYLEKRILHERVKAGDPAGVKALLEEGHSADSRDSYGSTPLHWAAMKGRLEIAKLLLDAKADMDARNDQGATPFLWAVVNGSQEVLDFFVAHGANVKAKTDSGVGGMEIALGESDGSLVKRLSRAGLPLPGKIPVRSKSMALLGYYGGGFVKHVSKLEVSNLQKMGKWKVGFRFTVSCRKGLMLNLPAKKPRSSGIRIMDGSQGVERIGGEIPEGQEIRLNGAEVRLKGFVAFFGKDGKPRDIVALTGIEVPKDGNVLEGKIVTGDVETLRSLGLAGKGGSKVRFELRRDFTLVPVDS